MKGTRLPVVCSVGSTDPTGAAGISTDLRVYARLRAVGVAVVAGVTAQNSHRVAAAAALPPALIRKQFEALWEQVTPDAVCIGLLPGAVAAKAVAAFLKGLSHRPATVIDPVISATSGRRFLEASDVRELARLLPLATLVTPNLAEAAALTGMRVATRAQAEAAAHRLSRYGCAVLVTGGHMPGSRCIDVLARGDRITQFSASRLRGSLRGAGGILAAAIAAHLAHGESVEHAVALARRFVRRAHRIARRIGSGKCQFIG